jgi:hypothetical protein
MAIGLTPYLPAKGCVAGRNLGDAQRALLHYFSGLTTIQDGTSAAARCDTLLVQYGRQFPDTIKGWRSVWEGQRRGDDTEHFALYAKDGT